MNLQLLALQLLLFAFTALGKTYKKSNDAVLLSKVRSLTLQSGKQTTARRVQPIPQLTCLGGSGKGHYDVDVMRCENSGSEYDAEDIQWTCKANLPPEFKLGSTDVVCEGFDSSEDPYILKGSCGVEYRLILTEMGEEKYGSGRWYKSKSNKYAPPKSDSKSDPKSGSSEKSWGSTLFSYFFWIAFIGIVCLILYSIVNERVQGHQPRNPIGGGGGFWGGGGGDDNDPPPPYTPRAPPRPKAKSSAPRTQPRSQPSSRSSNSTGGFWTGAGTGAAGGAAAGYAAGQYTANRRHEQAAREQEQRPANFGQGGSSWFGGGGGGSSAAGPSSAPSSSRHESSGFGGTRRR